MTGCGSFGYLGHGLVLRRADTVLETALAAIEQAVKHFDLLLWLRCACQKRALTSIRLIRARACSRLLSDVLRNHCSQAVMSRVPFWLASRMR